MQRTRPPQPPGLITPSRMISDPALLAPFFAGDSWDTWKAILKAAHAEPMTDAEVALFHKVAGDRPPPRRRVKELWIIAGRRSGKDSIASGIATAAAMQSYAQYVRPGERPSILCLAVDREQAKIVHGYVKGYFASIPLLSPLVVQDKDDGLRLSNGVDITIGSNNFRAIRGRTFPLVIFDEVAFWRDEDSANPDQEIYNAVMPGLVTLPGSMLVGITTAYRRSGLAYSKWADAYGKDDPDVLVVYGPTRAFNSTIPQSIIDDAIRRDPDAARAEWLSEWRSDISDFLDRQLVEAAVETGIIVRPPEKGKTYRAFTDPSGGRGDSFTAGIAHADDNVAILDCIYERRSPFDPSTVVTEIADLLRSYGINSVTGDRYAAGWTSESFQREGIRYEASERDRSAIYMDALPLFTSGRAKLLDHERLSHQLISLERRTSRTGKDTIDHAPGSHDDVANAAAGALVLVAADPGAIWKRPWAMPSFGMAAGCGDSAVLRAAQVRRSSALTRYQR